MLSIHDYIHCPGTGSGLASKSWRSFLEEEYWNWKKPAESASLPKEP